MAAKRSSKPVGKGRHAGLYAVRWRPAQGVKQVTGYLPRLSLLDDYSDYEQECWAEGKVPDAPEVRYAAAIAELQAKRSTAKVATAAVIEAGQTKCPTLTEWVGTRSKSKNGRGKLKYTYDLGPYFRYARSKSTAEVKQEHVRLVVGAAWMADIRDRPMNQIKTADFKLAFQQMLACPSCMKRAKAAGLTPGSDSLPWEKLVPVNDGETFDGADCAEHRTEQTRSSYEGKVQRYRSHFGTTNDAEALDEVPGLVALMATVVPKLDRTVPGRIVFKGSVHDGDPDEQTADELRYGLSYADVQRLVAASPERLAVLPIWASLTLSRGGQELAGTRIRDFQPTDPFAVRDWNPDTTSGATSMLHVHNFRRYRVDVGRVVNKPTGKTQEKSRRECPAGPQATHDIAGHIATHRSTPAEGCPACDDGIGHWSAADMQNNPHIWDESDGGVRCPMAAGAPLFTQADGGWFDSIEYTSQLWPAICGEAGLTAKTLGWKPLPRHFRSTGTGLMMAVPGVDVELVVKLGGWANADMLRAHYHRHNPEQMRAAAVEFERYYIGSNDASDTDRLDLELRRERDRVKWLSRKLERAGVDTDDEVSRVTGDDIKLRFDVMDDDHRVLDTVRTVILEQIKGPPEIIELLDGQYSASRYKKLRATFTRLRLPFPPRAFSMMAPVRQQPYLDALTEALDAADGPQAGGLRSVRTASVETASDFNPMDDDQRVIDAIRTVIVEQRKGPVGVCITLGMPNGRHRFRDLQAAFTRLDLPYPSNQFQKMRLENQQLYVDELTSALDAHDSPKSVGLRAV